MDGDAKELTGRAVEHLPERPHVALGPIAFEQ